MTAERDHNPYDLKNHKDFMSVAIRSKKFDDWLGAS